VKGYYHGYVKTTSTILNQKRILSVTTTLGDNCLDNVIDKQQQNTKPAGTTTTTIITRIQKNNNSNNNTNNNKLHSEIHIIKGLK